jgi:hypothetical protein
MISEVGVSRLVMKGAAMSGLIFLCLTLTLVTREVTGHGRLIEPPSRASMWRYIYILKTSHKTKIK